MLNDDEGINLYDNIIKILQEEFGFESSMETKGQINRSGQIRTKILDAISNYTKLVEKDGTLVDLSTIIKEK